METLLTWDLGVPIDARLVVALATIFLASFAKGVAGLGVPIIATPILASLYDIRTAIVIVALPMALSDTPFVIRGLPYYRMATRMLPFMAFGLVGVVIGAHLLVTLHQAILAAVLGTVVMIYVVTSWTHILPTLSPRAARYAGPPIGLISGVIQGSAGASGPITTMYLLSIGLPRHLFLFFINAIFQVLDITQVFALNQVGLYTPGLVTLTLLACIPMGMGVFLGMRTQKYVDDVLFRRIVLVILLLAAANLFYRVFTSL